MSLLPVGISGEAAYTISRSLRFNSSDSSYLNRTPASAGNRKTWTWSGWVKKSTNGSVLELISASPPPNGVDQFFFSATDTLVYYFSDGTIRFDLQTTQVFRDLSAWYHMVLAVDTTQATSTNRAKIYVNGAQVTAFSTATYAPQNQDTYINNSNLTAIGSQVNNGSINGLYLNGYLTEINFIDGQALTPSSFGETDTDTGVWKPKKYTGTYGTNGFYLNFSDNSGTSSTTLGKDSSGNGNNWTPNNFSVTAGAGNDSLVDTPTNYGTDTGLGGEVRGNYATLNALQDSATLVNGNLDATSLSSYSGRKATMQLPTTGKWYWETTVSNTSTTAGNWFIVGMVTNSFALTSATVGVANAISFGDRNDSVSGVFNETTTVFQSASINFATNDILQCAYDADSGKFWFGKNNSWYDSSGTTTGNPSTGSNQTLTASAKEWFPFFQGNNTSSAANLNFGQRAFAHAAPTGFKALCTQNLPEPTIVDGGDYFNAVLWTGNGSTSRGITGVGFQPDFVWLKARSLGAQNHTLVDAVRGYGTSAMDTLSSNLTTQEVSDASNASFTPYYGNMQSLNADGFTVAGGSTGIVDVVNKNNETYVAWNWKANGAGSTNTAGTITSTVSVNTTSGFSIVTYTGNGVASATVGHGLGVAPVMVIAWARNTAQGNCVWHQGMTSTAYYMQLSSTAGQSNTPSSVWNGNINPTSTTFSPGNNGSTNTNGNTFVAYCFAQIPGYSAFGSYTGNGSADGPFVYCGFRPRFVLVKCSSSDQGGNADWRIQDSSRDPSNLVGNLLFADLSLAESSGNTLMDFTSNGFKIRGTSTGQNANGATYIYAAFAENPFKYSLAR